MIYRIIYILSLISIIGYNTNDKGKKTYVNVAIDSSGDIEGVNYRDFLRKKTWIKKHFYEITDLNLISKQPIKINVTVLKRLRNEDYCNQEGIFDSIRVDFTNVTDSIIQLWLYSAFWTKNWITNSIDLDFNYQRTGKREYSNVRPYLEQLLPNKTYSNSIALQYKGNANEIKDTKFYIGLVFIKKDDVYIDEMSFEYYKGLYKNLCDTSIMWSEPFKLQ